LDLEQFMNVLTTTARPRNLWLERLAHALPYLMFAAAMLLLDRLGRGATQEEFLKSLSDSVNNTGPNGGGGGSAGGVIVFLSIIGALVGIIAILNRIASRRPPRARGAVAAAAAKTSHQPRKLAKEIAKAAGLSGEEMRQLKALAEQHGHASPLTLLICPSLLIDGARHQDTKADKAVLASVARKVIAK
jgi:hypothetical protein